MNKTLLDADYVTRDGKAVIRLFYKSSGKRTIEEVSDFAPYFYAVPKDVGKLESDLKKFPQIVRVEKETKRGLVEDVVVLKVTVKEPGNVPEIRGEVRELDSCDGVREASIPFSERYLIDSGILPMENADKADLRIASFDMEVYNPHGVPSAEKDPIIMISYADSAGHKKVWSYKHNEIDLDYAEILVDEAEVIAAFVETIKKQEIDILVTYNGDNFDFPYLRDRAAKKKVAIDLGVDGSTVKLERRGMNMGARVRGRPHVDMYPVCRQLFNLSRYTLEDVYRELFGKDKLDVEVENMAKVWDGKDRKKIEELFEYSLSDAQATLKIAESIIALHYELARITGQPIYECSRSGSGQRVEDLLVKIAHEKRILVPNRPSERIAEERLKNPYEGAYVVDPDKGIHDNIALFDFRSLYPSIIISHNIDPATLDCSCCKAKGEHFEAPTGHFFCKKLKGFIPGVLRGLVERRMEVKAEMKKEKDAGKKKFLDVQQQALKILANSMYGYYGFPRARWYSRECAEAIAAWGRDYIHKTIKEAEAAGFSVVYGDTDSVYITVPGEQDTKKLLEKAQNFSKNINEKLPEAMELEFQGFYPRGIFITKKRYALMDEKGALTVKGLETRRRDWSEISKKTQEAVLGALLKEKDPEKAADIVKATVKRIREGKVPLKELVINTQLTRGMGEYVSEGPHVLAAKKAMKEGQDYKQGDIIPYVVTNTGKSISDRARVVSFVEEGEYDQEYYVNNQVIPAVLRILEALGYSEDELKGMGKQMTLGDY